MSFLRSRLKTASAWEEFAKTFFGHWEDAGLGNLDKTKLEALLIYCLYDQKLLPQNGNRVSLSEAMALNKSPFDVDRLLFKGFTLFHKEPIDTQILVDTAVGCLVSSADRVINGRLEFHCSSHLDTYYIIELFERCGVNPEQGRNSKILQVDLSLLDGNRLNISNIHRELCSRLDISMPTDASSLADKGNGGWLVEILTQSKSELTKVSISVVAREILTSLLHHCQ